MSIQANKDWLNTLPIKGIRELAKYYFIPAYRTKLKEELIDILSQKEDLAKRPTSKADTYTRRILEFWDRSLQKKLDTFTHEAEYTNDTCGDWVHMYAVIEEGIFKDLQFIANGCCLSEAGAAMLVDLFRGKPVQEARGWSSEAFAQYVGSKAPEHRLPCILTGFNCLGLILNEKT